MSENVSPNQNVWPNSSVSPNASLKSISRKLKQTKLVLNENRGIILDSNLKKSNPLMTTSSKRLKVENQCLEEPLQTLSETDPRVDENPQDSIDDIIVIEDNGTDLPVGTNDALIEDCNHNKPTVRALKTMDQLKEECISLGLILNDHICEESSDEKMTQNDSKGANFEVESIFDSRLESDRITYYSVKWKNWSEEHNTWEPLSNLMNCRKLVNEYNYIQKNFSEKIDIYHNFYKFKGIIEDIVERKVSFGVSATILLVFNEIRLKDFNYTKASVDKMRKELRDKYLSKIDKISETERAEKRVDQLMALYDQLIEELHILKRFNNFEEFFEFFFKRKQTENVLNRWERDINDIIVDQKEGQTIRVENFFDYEVPPPAFKYISNCMTVDANIVISNEPPVYCTKCEDCESQSSDCCVVTNQPSPGQSPICYTRNQRLKDSRNNKNAIYECNDRCKCSQNCINRVVQKGRKHRLAIFRTDDGKGWGVRALEPIQKGSYVMEYVGEIISVDEADRRGHIYDAEGRTYLFDLDYTPDEIAKYTLDATQCGNVSHFVNHSCDPNLDTRVVWINNLDPFMPHIALFAVTNIKLNEELTFDYKINVHGITDADKSQDLNGKDSTINSDKSYDSGIDGSTCEPKPVRVSCQCGANNCRKYLY